VKSEIGAEGSAFPVQRKPSAAIGNLALTFLNLSLQLRCETHYAYEILFSLDTCHDLTDVLVAAKSDAQAQHLSYSLTSAH
jgi:PhoPQ-activated pathogenicity-related protein